MADVSGGTLADEMQRRRAPGSNYWRGITAGLEGISRRPHPGILWRPIQAQWHVLAHDFGEIKHDRLWRVAVEHVPTLITLLELLVPPLPNEDRT